MADLLQYRSSQGVTPETPNVLQEGSPSAPIYSALGRVGENLGNIAMQEHARDVQIWLRGATNQAFVDVRGMLSDIETNMPKELVGDSYTKEFDDQFKERLEDYKSNLDPRVLQYIEPEINDAWLDQTIRNRKEAKTRQIEYTLNATNTAVQLGMNDFINATGSADGVVKERGKAQARIEKAIRDLGGIANLREDEIQKSIEEQMWQVNQAAFDRDKESRPDMAELFIDQGIYTTDESKKTNLHEQLKIAKDRQDEKASQDLRDTIYLGIMNGEITPEDAKKILPNLQLNHQVQALSFIQSFQEDSDKKAQIRAEYEYWNQMPNPRDPDAQKFTDQAYSEQQTELSKDVTAAGNDEEKLNQVVGRSIAQTSEFLKRYKRVPSQVLDEFVKRFDSGDVNAQVESVRLFKTYYDAAPDAWQGIDYPEILYYKSLSYVAEANLVGIEDAVKKFERFKTQYKDPAFRKKFEDYSKTKEAQDAINKSFAHLDLDLPAATRINHVLTTMVSVGLFDTNKDSLQKGLNVVTKDLQYSPYGIGPVYDSNGDVYNTIYTPGRTLGIDPQAFNEFWLEKMKSAGYDIEPGYVTEKPPGGKVSSSYIPRRMFVPDLSTLTGIVNKPYYRLEGTSDTPNSNSWLLVQVNPDGTEGYIYEPDGRLRTFTFNYNMWTEWMGKRMERIKAENTIKVQRVREAQKEISKFRVFQNDLR